MRIERSILVIVSFLPLAAVAWAQSGTDDKDLGLDKHSVFDTPDPIVAVDTAADPGDNALLGNYFDEAPPLIPHQIAEFLPITLDNNQCLECHDQPEMIGKEIPEGEPTPAPASHYTDLRRDPDKVTGHLVGARYVCTQCHAPQDEAKPLVENTYRRE